MAFAKIRDRLGFLPARTVADGAREVAAALDRRDFEVTDPRTMTVEWYQKLLASGGSSPADLPR